MLEAGSYYDKRGKPIPMMVWAKLFENKSYKIIEQTLLPNKRLVSTVWLGLDHSFGCSSKPFIFETMVFKRKFTGNFKKDRKMAQELDTLRYSTLKEAKQGHKELCEKWGKKK